MKIDNLVSNCTALNFQNLCLFWIWFDKFSSCVDQFSIKKFKIHNITWKYYFHTDKNYSDLIFLIRAGRDTKKINLNRCSFYMRITMEIKIEAAKISSLSSIKRRRLVVWLLLIFEEIDWMWDCMISTRGPPHHLRWLEDKNVRITSD